MTKDVQSSVFKLNFPFRYIVSIILLTVFRASSPIFQPILSVDVALSAKILPSFNLSLINWLQLFFVKEHERHFHANVLRNTNNFFSFQVVYDENEMKISHTSSKKTLPINFVLLLQVVSSCVVEQRSVFVEWLTGSKPSPPKLSFGVPFRHEITNPSCIFRQ